MTTQKIRIIFRAMHKQKKAKKQTDDIKTDSTYIIKMQCDNNMPFAQKHSKKTFFLKIYHTNSLYSRL